MIVDLDFNKSVGLGVAGNFAGHLEQAGEAVDFQKVKVTDAKAPKALFPFYLPSEKPSQYNSVINVFPLSSDTLVYPNRENCNLQIEPEIGLLSEIIYEDGKVVNIVPKYFGAYNDCSIRVQGAQKISQKKNWGALTKGYASNLIPVDRFDENGVIHTYKISCFLKRNNEIFVYGVDSFARDYSYMYQTLLNWIMDKMNNQKDEGPAEEISLYLKECNYPQYALFSIGATRYTEFGESNYLTEGDVSYVVVYPEKYSFEEIKAMVENDSFKDETISVLAQKVIKE